MANAVLVSSELQAIKDTFLSNLKADVTTIQVGDDNTTPLESDTSIGNLIGSALLESVDESVADELIFNTKFGITSFVGSTIRETTLFDGVGIKTRALTVEALKGGDQIFWVSTKVKITAVNKL